MGAPRPTLPLLLLLLTAAIGRARKCERGSGAGVLSPPALALGIWMGQGRQQVHRGWVGQRSLATVGVPEPAALCKDRTWAVALQGGERAPWEACCQPSILSPFLTEDEVLESVSPSCSSKDPPGRKGRRPRFCRDT